MTITCSPVVVRFGRLGDTVLLQPLLRKLSLRYGQPCRLLALGNWPSVLFSAQPEVGSFISLATQYGPLWLRPGRWQATFALSRLRNCPFYIAEPVYRARTKLRPMLKLAGIPQENCQFIEDVPEYEDEHWLDWLSRFGDATPMAFREKFEFPPVDVCNAPDISVSATERAEGDHWLRAHGLAHHSFVLLQPANKRTMRWNGVRAAADDIKSWPVERWSAVAQAIRQQMPHGRVLLCGSPDEASYLRQLKIVMGTETSDIEVAAVPLGCLKALLEKAHSMVSVDTGPAHLAAALGCPLVVLFGGRSPRRWAPRSGHGSPIAVLGGLPDILRVDQIDARQVVDAWCRLLPDAAAAGQAVAT